MKLTPVTTPSVFQPQNDKRALHELGSTLTAEINTYGCWTSVCTSLMKENPHLLFLYDRFELCLGNAYGHNAYKIILNPMMIVCYHPDCLQSKAGPVVKLKHPYYLKTYLTHLGRHCDMLGDAMKKRYGAIDEDLFMTHQSLDNVSQSPYSLQPNLKLNCNVGDLFQKYGITRELKMNYVCHWKNWLLKHEIINVESLSFQEDEALIHCVLNYPRPVHDWKLWKTLYLYGLKMMTSISSAALNLYRGITNYPILNHNLHEQRDVSEFASSINHPTASVSSFQRELPDLNYSNESYHGGEILYHIKCLEKNTDSLALTFKNNQVVRFPITEGIDEQELNPGTFVKEGILHGLLKKMTCADIERIGLDSFCKYITEQNNFVVSVREYRATDYRSYVCSNLSTMFLSRDLNGEECLQHLKKSIKFANSCRMCLLDGVSCLYDRLDEPCSNCRQQCVPCISLAVLHVLWDMAPGHKKADKLLYHLSEESSFEEIMSTSMFTIGFGGLHLGKSFVCTARNYVLNYKGEHFGVNILNELKQTCEILKEVNNSVFVGRDKQSDLLNYSLIGPKVQESLKLKSRYLVSRVPEKYLPYKENAKSHKRIISPVSVCANRNGDIFVLDSGGCCVHVIDNSSVAKMSTIGCYEKSNLNPYPVRKLENDVKNLRLGNDLKDIQIDHQNDDMFILDGSRKEIILIKGCKIAKKMLQCRFFIMNANSISFLLKDSNLFTLQKSDNEDGFLLQQIKIQTPNYKNVTKSNDLGWKISCKILKSYAIPVLGDILLFNLPYENMIGLFHGDGLSSVTLSSDGVANISHIKEIQCDTKPHVSSDEKMVCWSRDKDLSLYKLTHVNNTISISIIDNVVVDGRVQALFLYGSVASVVAALNNSECTRQFAVLEWGSLGFSKMYCDAVHKLYQAISYIPPFGNKDKMQMECLTDSIDAAEVCCKLLGDMQLEKENIFIGRESFQGCEGIPWSATIECLERTIQSWKMLIWRLESIQCGSSKKVMPRCITNESYVEHSFGFTKMKGQGNNQSQEEYVQSKRTHMVDFQMRMCKLPFCQYTKTKLRDKGYQEVETRQFSLSLKEFCEIFNYSEKQEDGGSTLEPITEKQEQLLKKAHLLTKYVPRQSGRNRWRAAAGQAPTMIVSQSSAFLYDGDLVFSRDLSGNLLGMIVKKKTALIDSSTVNLVNVSVLKGEKKTENVIITQLICVKQQIFTVPASYYSVVDSEIYFSDEFQPLFDEVIQEIIEGNSDMTDEEWSLLLQDSKKSQNNSPAEEESNKLHAADHAATTNPDEVLDFNATSSRGKKRKIELDEMVEIDASAKKAQESLEDDHNKGKFYCVYFDNQRYWGKLTQTFANDVDEPVESVEMDFLHYKCNDYWDYPKGSDIQSVQRKFIFLGPVVPSGTSKQGLRFNEDKDAVQLYNAIKYRKDT